MKTKLKETYECRFPGCEHAPYGRTQDRGRHEAVTHGMKGGKIPNWILAQQAKKNKRVGNGGSPAPEPTAAAEVPETTAQAAPPPPPPAETQVPAAFVEPRKHLEQAIDDLNRRERQLNEEIDRLESLRAEAQEVGRQKGVLSEALEKLVREAPAKPEVPPVNLQVHGSGRSHAAGAAHSEE